MSWLRSPAERHGPGGPAGLQNLCGVVPHARSVRLRRRSVKPFAAFRRASRHAGPTTAQRGRAARDRSEPPRKVADCGANVARRGYRSGRPGTQARARPAGFSVHRTHRYREGVNTARRAVAADVLTAAREHDAAQSDRLARFRNVEPETGEFLGVLVRAIRAAHVLELGTSNGYSTIWLADGVEGVRGRVVSVDIDAERIALARDNLERAGLEADLRVADAAEVLTESASGTWTPAFLTASGTPMPVIGLICCERFASAVCLSSTTSSRTPVRSRRSWPSCPPNQQPRAPQCPSGRGVQLIVKNP